MNANFKIKNYLNYFWYLLIFIWPYTDSPLAPGTEKEILKAQFFKFLNLWFTHFPLTPSQGFKNKPKVFITVQHKHTDRPYDSMNLWLENVSKNKFNVCMREFMAFDGIHSDLKVVR